MRAACQGRRVLLMVTLVQAHTGFTVLFRISILTVFCVAIKKGCRTTTTSASCRPELSWRLLYLTCCLQGTTRLTFKMATRGLLGLKNALLTATRGMGLLNTLFDNYKWVFGASLGLRDSGVRV